MTPLTPPPTLPATGSSMAMSLSRRPDPIATRLRRAFVRLGRASLSPRRGGATCRATAAVLVAVLVGLVPPAVHAAGGSGGGSWAPAAQLSAPRSETTVTALDDGRVLVAGGGNPAEALAEVLDPVAGTWAPVSPMGEARVAHAAVALADGRVLVSGGRLVSDALTSAEVFDPAAGTWTPVEAMSGTRQGHTATLLASGKVLVAGGLGGGHGPHRSEAELFDPASGTWSPTGAMPQARAHHTATLLGDGRVLVVGGEGAPHDASLRDAAVYEPEAGTWAPVPSLLASGRSDHTTTALADGTALVAGGTKLHTGGRPQNILSSAEVLDRAGRAFLPAPAMAQRRSHHSATALDGGRVLVVGGFGERMAEATATAEIYDAGTRRWMGVAPLPEPAAGHAAVVLGGTACGTACGKVVVVGERSAFVFTAPPVAAGGGAGGIGGVATVAGVLGGALVLLTAAGVVVTRRRHSSTSSRTYQTMEYR